MLSEWWNAIISGLRRTDLAFTLAEALSVPSVKPATRPHLTSRGIQENMVFSLSLARLTLLEALRTRLPWLVAILIVASLGLAKFLNQVAIIEAVPIQATLLAALFRLAAVFVVVVFVVTSMVREAGDKVGELLLSQAEPRAAYYFGKLAGYFAVSVLIAVGFSLPLALFAPHAGLALWTLSLIGELALMAAASLFCVLSLTQVVSAISAAAGFYLLSRSLATMQLIAAASLTHDPTWSDRVMNGIVTAIAMLLPSLDRMTLSSWLVEVPDPHQLANVFMQAALYLVLLASASLFDLYRRNF